MWPLKYSSREPYMSSLMFIWTYQPLPFLEWTSSRYPTIRKLTSRKSLWSSSTSALSTQSSVMSRNLLQARKCHMWSLKFSGQSMMNSQTFPYTCTMVRLNTKLSSSSLEMTLCCMPRRLMIGAAGSKSSLLLSSPPQKQLRNVLETLTVRMMMIQLRSPRIMKLLMKQTRKLKIQKCFPSPVIPTFLNQYSTLSLATSHPPLCSILLVVAFGTKMTPDHPTPADPCQLWETNMFRQRALRHSSANNSC